MGSTVDSISRFTDTTRQAASYRKGRVLLAGDAAHVHLPIGRTGPQHRCAGCGEFGMEAGPGGQADVAGKPSGYLSRRASPGRCPRPAQYDGASRAAASSGRPHEASATWFLIFWAWMTPQADCRDDSGLDIKYDLGEGHPLLGRRMPDLDLVTSQGPQRTFALLHHARPALLNFSEPGQLDITQWADRVQLVDAKYFGAWELPVIGTVTPPAAVLIRPDGYVAWVGDKTDQGLADALTTWFGPPTAA